MKKWLTMFFWIYIPVAAFAQNINHLEYFFDKDSGAVNTHTIPITASDTLKLTNLSIPVTGISEGMHTIYFRTKNNESWGLTEGFPFYIAAISDVKMLIGAEYFIDKDPGPGEAFTINPAVAGDTIKLASLLPDTTKSPGFHSLNIRFKDESGNFSLFESFPFYITTDITNMPKIIAAEYFFGQTDPGPGNATPLDIAPGDTVIKSFSIPVSCITTKTDSIYNLYVRVKDELGHWSLLEKDTFNMRGPNTVITVKDGNWSDASVWSNNTVPVDSTNVILNHTITVDINAVCRSLFTFCNIVKINPGFTVNVTGHQ